MLHESVKIRMTRYRYEGKRTDKRFYVCSLLRSRVFFSHLLVIDKKLKIILLTNTRASKFLTFIIHQGWPNFVMIGAVFLSEIYESRILYWNGILYFKNTIVKIL